MIGGHGPVPPWIRLCQQDGQHLLLPSTPASATQTSRGHGYHEAAGIRFIFSRLDYCNAVLYGLPQSTIGPLQRVHNAAARVTLGLSLRDRVRPALRELHWLLVAHRIQYKVTLLLFMVNDNRCHVYLSESVQPVTSNPVHQRLLSASSLDFIVPQTRTKFGDRVFSVAGPTVWNSLSESVRSAETFASFKRKMKTYLFNISF